LPSDSPGICEASSHNTRFASEGGEKPPLLDEELDGEPELDELEDETALLLDEDCPEDELDEMPLDALLDWLEPLEELDGLALLLDDGEPLEDENDEGGLPPNMPTIPGRT